jgi:hypothetical protein
MDGSFQFPTFRLWWSRLRAVRPPRVRIKVRFPRMRFTVRRLIVVVTGVGILLGVFVLRRRADEYSWIAGRHEFDADLCERSAGGEEMKGVACGPKGCYFFDVPAASTAEERAKMLRLAQHHYTLMWKYERAARLPWFPVEPDPPAPE